MDKETFEKAVGLLAWAKQHDMFLTLNGDKILLQGGDPADPDKDIVRKALANHKQELIAILKQPKSIRSWLEHKQHQLGRKYDSLHDGMEQWLAAEEMYRLICPDDKGCICEVGECTEMTFINCRACSGTYFENLRVVQERREVERQSTVS